MILFTNWQKSSFLRILYELSLKAGDTRTIYPKSAIGNSQIGLCIAGT